MVDAKDVENASEIAHTQQIEILAEKGVTLQQHSLKTDEFHKLVDLIFRNKDLFATSMHDLVGTKVETMHIDTETPNQSENVLTDSRLRYSV